MRNKDAFFFYKNLLIDCLIVNCLKAGPLRKKELLKNFLMTRRKKGSMAIKLEGGGGKALIARPIVLRLPLL